MRNKTEKYGLGVYFYLPPCYLQVGSIGITLRKATVPVSVPFSQSSPLSSLGIVFASFPGVVEQSSPAVSGVALSPFSQKALPTTF